MIRSFFVICSLFILLDCKQSTSPDKPIPLEEKNKLQNFHIKQVDYDTVRFWSNNEIILKEKYINKINLLLETSTGLENILSLSPTYIQSDSGFYLNFDFKIVVDLRWYLIDLILQYTDLNDNNHNFNDSIPLYKFPYESAEIFMYHKEIDDSSAALFLDVFYIDDQSIFYYFFNIIDWRNYIYKYNIESKNRILYDDISQDFYNITCNSEYIFFMPYNDSNIPIIERYNLATKIIDLTIDLTEHNFSTISDSEEEKDIYSGLGIYNNELYLVAKKGNAQSDLHVFSINGNYLRTIFYGIESYNVTVVNNILYSCKRNAYNILRYDLNTETFLSDIPDITLGGSELFIRNEKVYFSDRIKRIIIELALTDLNHSH